MELGLLVSFPIKSIVFTSHKFIGINQVCLYNNPVNFLQTVTSESLLKPILSADEVSGM